MSDQTKSFFERLFANVDLVNSRICVWTLPDKKSRYFDSPDGATEASVALSKDHDVYYGLATVPPGLSSTVRGKNSNVRFLPALGVDLDVAGTADKKSDRGLPSLDDAYGLLTRVEYPPSIVVRSGHGLHAYWLLLDPIDMLPAEGRSEAAGAIKQWWGYIEALVELQGHRIDPTHDLARVYRVPGTFNRKDPDHPSPVEMTQDTGERYTLEHLMRAAEAFAPLAAVSADPAPREAPVQAVLDNGIVVDPGACLDSEKIALAMGDTRFSKAWQRKLGHEDQSKYEWELALIGSEYRWSDQDIVNMIIQHRRASGIKVEKRVRKDYLARTLSKVRTAQKEREAEEELENVEACNDNTNGDVDRMRHEYLRRRLKLDIVRFTQHGIERPQYYMHLGDGTDVPLGGAQDLLSNRAFRARVLGKCRQIVPSMKQGPWDQIAKRIVSCAVVEENPLDGRMETIRFDLSEYLLEQDTIPSHEDGGFAWMDALKNYLPVRKGDRIHISMRSFLKFCNRDSDRVTRGEMISRFRVIGSTVVSLTARLEIGGKSQNICRKYWQMPGKEFLSQGLVGHL